MRFKARSGKAGRGSRRRASLSLVRQDLGRRAFRTIVLVGAVGTVVGALFLTMLLANGATFSAQAVRDKLGADILVIPQGTRLSSQPFYTLLYTPGPSYMSDSYEEIVKTVPGVQDAAPQLYITYFLPGAWVADKMYIVAINPDNSFLKSWLPQNRSVVLGENESILGWEFPPLKVMPNNGVFYGTHVTDVYRLPRTGTFIDRAIFVSFPTAEKMRAVSYEWQRTNFDPGASQDWLIPISFSPGQISALFVQVSKGTDPQQVADTIQSTYTQVRAVTVDSLVDSAQERFGELFSTFSLSSLLIWGASVVLVSAFTSATTNERRGEFGVLRAVGATRFFVWRLVAFQTLIVTGVAGAIGIAVASVVLGMFNSVIISNLQIPQQTLPLQDYLQLVVFAMGVSAALGVAGGVLPALRASRVEPYESIRQGAR